MVEKELEQAELCNFPQCEEFATAVYCGDDLAPDAFCEAHGEDQLKYAEQKHICLNCDAVNGLG